MDRSRMLGRQARLRGCLVCRTTSGPDCADASRTRRQQRAYEEREWRRAAEREYRDALAP